ncbi:MAG: S-layer homology domain-containing protein [Clostridia bacterium]|nr:S-layer homology domain-containing protein [Clostridia bacterium]
MLKGQKATALGLILMLLFSVAIPAVLAAPSGTATAQHQSVAKQMVENFKAYYEPFTAEEKAVIQASFEALKGLSDAQWKQLVEESGLKTAELIAKYDTEAEAEAALTELLKDTYQILYAVYDEDVLYDACLEFVVDEAPTIYRIYDGVITREMLVALIQDSEKTLAGFDISGSISDHASDYWNVVYGTGKNYIYAVDNVVEQAIEKTIEGSVLKTKMTALKWSTTPFADLHEKLIGLVDSDFRATTLMYDSILRKHSVLTNVTTGEQVSNGQSYTLTPGQSVTMKFTIFGKNVSVPFGSYIKLPENGSLSMTVNQSAGTFQVTGLKEVINYDMVVRRGVIGADELINRADVMKTFIVTCREGASPAPTPTHKVDFKPTSPTPKPTEKPELGAEIQYPDGEEVTVKLEETAKDQEYTLSVTVNGEDLPEGIADEKYQISVVIPTDYKGSDNIVLYYLDEDGKKIIVDQAKTQDGVITANVNYIGKYYVEKTSIDILEENHIAYMIGDDQGQFRPDANMTRAEAAQMFYNLLKNKNVTGSAMFRDVDDSAWYAQAVKVLASYKIVKGYEGLYRPEDSITREEFTAIAVRFTEAAEEGTVSFSDVAQNDWSYSYILTAASKGWIAGYADGTFRPQGEITRAEVATIVNRMLNRIPDKAYIDAHVDELKIFLDSSDKNNWAYYQIVEATNAHDCETTGETESWTALK